MAINRDFLNANHADLVAAILAEGKQGGVEQGRQEGAAAERTRIQSVFAQAMPGHAELVQKLAFDGKTTGDQAAAQILNAERAKLGKTAADIAADAADLANKPAPTPAADPGAEDTQPGADVDADKPLEERCKAKWDADAKLRGEFGGDYSAYLAISKAEAAGRVKVLGKKSA